MNSLILLALIQIINFNRVLSGVEPDPTQLDKFIDVLERNEHNIHNGIARGTYDGEDQHSDDDRDEDNYGKLLLEDMTNFREVKIPGVDYELEPVSIPIEVVEVNEIEEEAGPQDEGPPQDESTPQEESPPHDQGPPPQEGSPTHYQGPPQEESPPHDQGPPPQEGSPTHYQGPPQEESPPHDQGPPPQEGSPTHYQGPPQEESPFHDQVPSQEGSPTHYQGPLQEESPPHDQGSPQEGNPPHYQGPPDEEGPFHDESPPHEEGSLHEEEPPLKVKPISPKAKLQDVVSPMNRLPEAPPPEYLRDQRYYDQIQDIPRQSPERESMVGHNHNDNQQRDDRNHYPTKHNESPEYNERRRKHRKKSNRFGERLTTSPLPPLSHSSYQDSANLMDKYSDDKMDGPNDQHSGTLPHSHTNDGINNENEDYYHSHSETEPPPQSKDLYHTHEEPEDHNHNHRMDSNNPSDNDHNNHYHRRQENSDPNLPNINAKAYVIPEPQGYRNVPNEEPINSRETPIDRSDNDQQIEFNPILVPLEPIITVNTDSNSSSKSPEVGGLGDLILKYYEDQSKVDSQPLTRVAEVPKTSKTQSKIVKRDETQTQKFQNYKNINEPQVINENKQIAKRIGLTSNPNSEQKEYYYPINYKQSPEEEDRPTRGSRIYSKKQEYYEPNASMSDEEPPTDAIDQFYDQFAEEQIKYAQDKYKNNDHLKHDHHIDDPQTPEHHTNDNSRNNPNRDQVSDKRHHNHDQNKGIQPSDLSLSPEDYESSRPQNHESFELKKRQSVPSDHHSRTHPHHHHHYHRINDEEQDSLDSHPPEEDPRYESEDEPPPQSHYNNERLNQKPKSEEKPNHQRYSPKRVTPLTNKRSEVKEQENYGSYAQLYNAEPQSKRNSGISDNNNNNNNNNKQNEDKSNPKPDDNFQFDFPEKDSYDKKQTTGILDAMTPQNMSGIADNYQDYDNQNGQEMTEPENRQHLRSADESHQSSTPPTDMEDDSEEYEPQTKRQRSPHSHHSTHSHDYQPSHRSHPSKSHNNDKTSMNSYNNNNNNNNNKNNDYSQNSDYYRQNTDPRHRMANKQSMANQRHNEEYFHNINHKQKNPNQYSQQKQYEDEEPEEPRVRPYSNDGHHYHDEEKAATVDTSAQKADPKTGILLSDESQKILTQTNSSVNTNNDNKTIAIKSVESFSSWVKPLILKTRLIVVDDKNDTKILEKSENGFENKNKENRFKLRTIERKPKTLRNITRKPKIETQIKGIQTISMKEVTNKTQIYDMIANPNNKSEYHLKGNNTKTITPQLVRYIRTRPQRSISDNMINFGEHSINNQLSDNSHNSWTQNSVNILTHLTNRSLESREPKCAQISLIKNFCIELDEEYPLESIRVNLIRNLENIRSVHRKLNSSVTNGHYYEDSTDSLDNSCRTHKLTIRPLRAKNINGQWKVIANIGNLFEQKLTLTNCSEEHKECETNGQNYSSKCIQKYSLNDLITFDSENSDFQIDIFLIPNVCSCSAFKTNIF